MWARIINIIAGLLLMIAPGWLQFPTVAANNNYITGPLVITFSIIALAEVTRNVQWFNLFTGAWLIVSPFVLGYDAPASYINMLLGTVILALSFVRSKRIHRFGGGWGALRTTPPFARRK